MKYKVGDKVKLRKDRLFIPDAEESIKKTNSNRIVTIKEVENTHCPEYYLVKENHFGWTDDMIECLAEEYKEEIFEPILSRFELLDI